MSKLEVLVTTMNKTDFSIYRQMNLQTDAILANQSNTDECKTELIDGHAVKLITTSTRGVSRNRNIALAHSSQQTDYLMFADDDLVFDDGYEKKILDEFERHPEADAIQFNLHDLSDTRKISMKRITSFEKATRRNMASCGVWGIVLKTNVMGKYDLRFHEAFGPGTENYCGEDTVFIMRLLDRNVRLYRSPVDIAGIDQTESSWFEGYNERYFVTVGKVLREIYPLMAVPVAIRGACKFNRRERCRMGLLNIFKCYLKGIYSR